LIIILDHLKIGQVVCLGEGAGANIVARFAMAHSSRCLGLCLIHPSGSTASISETFNNKIVNVIKCFPKSSLTKSQVSYLIWHRYGNVISFLLPIFKIICLICYYNIERW
jgi:protein NDRG1